MAEKWREIINDDTGERYMIEEKTLDKPEVYRKADGTLVSYADAGFHFADEPKRSRSATTKPTKEG